MLLLVALNKVASRQPKTLRRYSFGQTNLGPIMGTKMGGVMMEKFITTQVRVRMETKTSKHHGTTAQRHNGRLLRHSENGDEVLLFLGEKGPGGLWKYECELSLIDYEFFQTKDRNNRNRKAVRFILQRVVSNGASVNGDMHGNLSQTTTSRFQTKPSTTERKGLVTSRVGQGYYRQEILRRFEGRCAVTGVNSEELLIASHIVPWRDSNEFERLDVNNGILLSPTYDALFDKHLISFEDDGHIVLSTNLPANLFSSLGVSGIEKIKVFEGMKVYLLRHRENLR